MRKRRTDLGILQRQVADLLSVDVMSVVGWEVAGREPLVRHIPQIIEFLGYVPEDLFPARTTGEKIRRYRMLKGMTRRQLAQELDLDEGTLRSVETDERKHAAQTTEKIARLFKSLL